MKKDLLLLITLAFLAGCGSFADKTHKVGRVLNGNTIQLADLDSFVQVKLLGVNCDGDLMDYDLKGMEIRLEFDSIQESNADYPKIVRGTLDTSLHTTIYAYVYVENINLDGEDYEEVFLNNYLLESGNATAYRVDGMKFYDEWLESYTMYEYPLDCTNNNKGLDNGLCEDYAGYVYDKNIAPTEVVPGSLCECVESATVKIIQYVITDDFGLIPLSQGSGFFINETGQILTNHHVVKMDNKIIEILSQLGIYKFPLVYTLSFKNEVYKDTLLAATDEDVEILSSEDEFDLAIISPSLLLPIVDPEKYQELKNFSSEDKVFKESGIFGKLIDLNSDYSFPYLFFQNREVDLTVDDQVAIIGSAEGRETLTNKGAVTGHNKSGNSFTYNAQTYHGHSGGPIINNHGLVIGIGTKGSKKEKDLLESAKYTTILSIFDENDIYYHEIEL